MSGELSHDYFDEMARWEVEEICRDHARRLAEIEADAALWGWTAESGQTAERWLIEQHRGTLERFRALQQQTVSFVFGEPLRGPDTESVGEQ